MAADKSEWLETNTTSASKYIPESPESASIKIPTFRLHFKFFSKTVSYKVNLNSQRSHLEVLLLSKFWSERKDFN
jgi:hypothetical protein